MLGMLPIGNGFLNATALVELCFFLSFSLLEGKTLKTDTFVEMHMYKFLENATVDFFYFFLKILFFYRVRKHVPLNILPRFPLVYVNKTIVRSETFSISIF